MKKVHLTILFTLSTILLFAQQKFTPETFFGVNGGATYSFVDFKPSVGEQRIFGYKGGISYRRIEQRFVGLQVELNYSLEGWSEDLSDIEDGSSYSRELTYIELPLLTHIFIGKKNRLYLNLGPNFRYLIGEKESIDLSEGLYREYYDEVLENNFDFGVVVGLGGSKAFKFGTLALEFRYHYGFTNIYKPDLEPFKESKNRSMSLTLSYYFLD